MIQKIKTTKEYVSDVLKKDIPSRDSDSRLVCIIWWKQGLAHNLDIKQITAHEFMIKLLEPNSIFTSSDVITRARRLVQAINPELRGSKYDERHENEKIVRKNINKI